MQFWPFIPQIEVTETLEWLTDILPTKTGEQRICLRQDPRQGLQFRHFWTPQQFSKAQTLAAGSGSSEIRVPLWQYNVEAGAIPAGATALTFDTTTGEYFSGALLVVWDADDKWEVAVTEEVTPSGVILSAPLTNSYTRAVVAPVKAFWFNQAMDATRGATEVVRAAVYFLSTDASTLPGGMANPYPQVAGHDVLTDQPALVGTIQDRLARQVEWVDPGLGIRHAVAVRDYVDSSFQMGWDLLTREDLWRLRHWLYSRRGRQVGFWLPTWNEDLVLASSISSASATQFTVKSIGAAAPEWQTIHPGRRIRFRLTNGGVYYRQIQSVITGPAGTEQINIFGTIGFTATPSQVLGIDFLDFARLDADRVEIKHRAAKGASLLVPVKRIPAP